MAGKKGNAAAKGAAPSGGGSSSSLVAAAIGSIAVLAVAAVLGIFWSSSASQDGGAQSSRSTAPSSNSDKSFEPFSVGRGLLEHFSREHNESLLWGTFRPGVLFGVKSRTTPEAVVAGLMWSSVAANGEKVDTSKLRHTCEESETKQGLVFGFSEHDGSSYGKQMISDPGNKLSLQTYFFKRTPHSWAMRVSGNTTGKGKKVVYVYLGIDEEFAGSATSAVKPRLSVDRSAGASASLGMRGSTPSLGDFRLLLVPGEGVLPAASGLRVVTWAAPKGTPIVGVKDALIRGLKQQPRADGGAAGDNQPAVLLQEASAENSLGDPSLLVAQVVVRGEFEVDIVFEGGAQGESEAAEMSGARLSEQLTKASQTFRKRFEDTFGLQQRGYNNEQIEFAQAAMSALLGGLGFFYGSSKVKVSDSDSLLDTPLRSLFTAVPSRSFFPRGFLWDEGFHQLLVSRWNPALSRDVIAHWLGSMRADGWIPREQILGGEAVSKVPDWAVPQHPTHANPPTFLLAIEALVERARSQGGSGPVDAETAAWLAVVLPSVERWFLWFVESQKGSKPGSFRWHGRDPNDGKLNAMTLSSGLDDYPRASEVSDKERHVDLHSWVAFGAGVMARISEHAGAPKEKVQEYRNMQEELVTSLDDLHWDPVRKRYCDFGLHSNDGKYAPHVVVKCGTPDGSNSVEHALSVDHYQQMQRGATKKPPCPSDFPKFLFPLGDGQGGLLMKEKFVPKKQREQFVDHTGYVSLFPLLLRLLPPDSERLPDLLELLGDPAHGIWSNFGLRSLAKGDKMYLRDNAPGDAPYWRGPIWINCNFLAVNALRHYAAASGPSQARAAELLDELSSNLVSNMHENYKRTHYLWEQYNPSDGAGQRTHPFNGWSSLVVLIMS